MSVFLGFRYRLIVACCRIRRASPAESYQSTSISLPTSNRARWLTASPGYVALTLIALGLATTALAVPGDLAGEEYLRQQDRERVLREQLERTPDVRLPRDVPPDTARIPNDESQCFGIRQIKFSGDAYGFEWALAAADRPEDPATGRCLGANGINLVMKRIQNAIVERGFVTTRVLAEPQDLTRGTLMLNVIPGRIRQVRFSDDRDARANAWNALPAGPGDLLNLRDIEQALENLKRVPTAEADIQIVPTDELGESDLVIVWKQAFPFRLTVSANDGGSSSTGKYLGSVTVSADHLLALNDLFYASVNHDLAGGSGGSHGTRGNTLHYLVPYGYWMLAATSRANRYHQTVAGASQDYFYSGTSANQEIKLSRLIYHDARNKTTVSLRGYLTQSRNYIDDTEVDVQHRRMACWEAAMAHRAFIAESTLDLDLAHRRGTGAFGSLPAPEETFGEGTARPEILTSMGQSSGFRGWPETFLLESI